MIAYLECFVLAALLAAGLSVYTPFLPAQKLPTRIFIILTSAIAILWMLCAWGMGFGTHSLPMVLAAGFAAMSLWSFRKENVIRAKVLLSFASGIGLVIVLGLFLQAYAAYKHEADIPRFLVKGYVSTLLLASTFILALLAHYKRNKVDVDQSLLVCAASFGAASSLVVMSMIFKQSNTSGLFFLLLTLVNFPFIAIERSTKHLGEKLLYAAYLPLFLALAAVWHMIQVR